jgi:hypothetical protein
MKRILPALLLIVVLAAGGAAVYYARKPGRGGGEAMAAIGYLPQNTLLLLAIPDPGQTADHWKTTDLYKIWAEPDVQAFLAMPLSKIPPDKDRDDMLAQAARLQPKNLFIAVTALDDKTNQPHLLAGFQFTGSTSDVDRLLGPVKDAWRRKNPAGKADLVNYQGHPIETFASDDGTTLASVYAGDWYFVANDVELLRTTLDRVDHRTPAAAPSLEKDGDFQAVSAKLPETPETLIFARVQPFVSRILALTAASGQPVSDEAKKEAEKGRAFGATTKIEAGRMRDTMYYLAPGLTQDLAPVQLGSLALTTANTLLYYASVYRMPAGIDLPDLGDDSPLGNPAAMLRLLGQQLQAKGITPEAARAALGSEWGFQLDWPADHTQPAVLWSVAVKDQAGAEKLVAAISSMPLGLGTWELQQSGPLALHVLTLPNIEAFRPTIAVTAKEVILGLTVSSVKDAAAREQSAAPNLSGGEAYKTAVAEVEKPTQAFSYLDTRTLFERVYGVVKPAALLGAAFLYPQANDYLELGKLPPVEAVSKHLSPTVMSATLDSQGELIESTGSVTLFQAGAALAGSSAAVAMPFLESKFGGMLPHAGAPMVPPPVTTPPAGP